jgi:hypothetical protein
MKDLGIQTHSKEVFLSLGDIVVPVEKKQMIALQLKQ